MSYGVKFEICQLNQCVSFTAPLGHDRYCSSYLYHCSLGDGDCDSDSECKKGLLCGSSKDCTGTLSGRSDIQCCRAGKKSLLFSYAKFLSNNPFLTSFFPCMVSRYGMHKINEKFPGEKSPRRDFIMQQEQR